jgi:hypothetical protein
MITHPSNQDDRAKFETSFALNLKEMGESETAAQ